MTECLREISHLSFGRSVVFLSQESDIVPQRQDALEHCTRLTPASGQDQIIRVPKAAGDECTFAGRQPIRGLTCIIAMDQAIEYQSPLDGSKSSLNARIVNGQEADEWQQQQAGIHCL